MHTKYKAVSKRPRLFSSNLAKSTKSKSTKSHKLRSFSTKDHEICIPVHSGNFNLLHELDDTNDDFILQTVPILASEPYFLPSQLALTNPLLVTKPATDPTTSLFNPATTLHSIQKHSVSHHKYSRCKLTQAGFSKVQFIQHVASQSHAFDDQNLEHASYIVPDGFTKRVLQYNEISPLIQINYSESKNVSQLVKKQHLGDIEDLPTELTVKQHEKFNNDFILPILRVGAVPYALMQVRYATPRIPQLRFLGGNRDEQYFNPRFAHEDSDKATNPKKSKRLLDNKLNALLPSPSIFNAMVLASEQTQGILSKLLYNLSRPHQRTYSHAELKAMHLQHPAVNFTTVEELIAGVDKLTRPQFLHYRYNRGRNTFNTVIKTRMALPGAPRRKIYKSFGAKTLGRIIATQIHESPTPIQHTLDTLTYANGVLENIEHLSASRLPTTETSAIHLLDLGYIQSDTRDALDPANSGVGHFVYPHLFKDVQATDEFKHLAIYMTQATGLAGVTNDLTHQALVDNYQGTEKKKTMKKHLQPFSSGLHPLVSTIQTIFETLSRDPHALENAKTQEDIVKILYNHFHLDSSAGIQALWSKAHELNDTDPQLLLWLTPLIYHLARPAVPHPSSRFAFEQYFSSPIQLQPPIGYQASSLQWVPLPELLRNDQLLAPRFTINSKMEAQIGKLKLNEQSLFERASELYGLARIDLVNAHKQWSEYFSGLPIFDRTILAKLSTYFDESGRKLISGSLNDAHCVDAGQLMATSTGQFFPIRSTHHDLLLTPQMASYLSAIVEKARNDSYSQIDTLDLAIGKKPFAERIKKRIRKYPALAAGFGYDKEETYRILNDPPTSSSTKR